MPIDPKDMVHVDVSNLFVRKDDLWLPTETYCGFRNRMDVSRAVVVFSGEQAIDMGAHFDCNIKFICVDFPRSLLATNVADCIRFFDEGKK
jgi:hypothetical protein